MEFLRRRYEQIDKLFCKNRSRMVDKIVLFLFSKKNSPKFSIFFSNNEKVKADEGTGEMFG